MLMSERIIPAIGEPVTLCLGAVLPPLGVSWLVDWGLRFTWMASLTGWMWVSVNSGSWWWTGRPGMLWFMGSQRVGHDWATDLIWIWLVILDPIDFNWFTLYPCAMSFFQRLCSARFPPVSSSFPEPHPDPQGCLYNLLERQPEHSWPWEGNTL